MSQQRRNSIIAPVVLLIVVAVVAGCGKKESPPPQAPQPNAATTKKPIQAKLSSAVTPAPEPKIDFTGKKDPFRSYAVPSKAKLPLPPLTDKLLPIQQYEVNQFKVLGIITGLASNRALVLDPTGKSYVIKEGTFIGRNNGRVVKITTKLIEITEQYRDDSGKIRNRTVNLALPRKE